MMTLEHLLIKQQPDIIIHLPLSAPVMSDPSTCLALPLTVLNVKVGRTVSLSISVVVYLKQTFAQLLLSHRPSHSFFGWSMKFEGVVSDFSFLRHLFCSLQSYILKSGLIDLRTTFVSCCCIAASCKQQTWTSDGRSMVGLLVL